MMSIQQVLNIQTLVLGYEVEKYALFVVMWIHVEEKMNCLGFWKATWICTKNMFLFGFYTKNMFKQGLGFFIVHFNTFVRNWVNIW